MSRLDKRFHQIVIKWSLQLALFLILWTLKIYHLIFLLILLFIQEMDKGLVWLGEGTQLGMKAYWSTYWTYWAMAYISLTVLLVVWYMLYYRRKRPYLIIGGQREGRVVWSKGIKRGLLYDLWDAKNYLAWKIKKNQLKPIPRPISDMSVGEEKVHSWPDPLGIPLGRPTSRTIMFFSRPWSLKLERLIVPNWVEMKQTFFSIRMPEAYIVNIPDPLSPGIKMLTMTQHRPGFDEYDSEAPRTDLVSHLDNVRTMVQASVAANPEVNIIDYEDGSWSMVEGADDA